MYKCCHQILHGLCFFDNALVACCYSPVDQVHNLHPPMIFDNYNGEIIKKDDLFKRIQPFVDTFKKGKVPLECGDCFKIEEKVWDEEQYIDYITITHFSTCNANCIYCSNNLTPEERTNNVYKIMPVLNSFKEEGVIRKGVELHIGGGEFSIYPEAEELLQNYSKDNFARIFIPTNAIKYNEFIFNAMDSGSTYIIVSLDSGTRETYKKIKRIDAFDTVIENLCKYTKTPTATKRLRLKYILVPGYNDNVQEFKKFLNIAHEFKAKYIKLDIDARYAKLVNFQINKHFELLVHKMQTLAEKEGFVLDIYSFLEQTLHSLKKPMFPLISNFIAELKFKYSKNEQRRIAELYDNYYYADRAKNK